MLYNIGPQKPVQSNPLVQSDRINVELAAALNKNFKYGKTKCCLEMIKCFFLNVVLVELRNENRNIFAFVLKTTKRTL